MTLKSSLLSTPIGHMMAVSDQEFLYLLEFNDSPNLKKKLYKILKYTEQDVTQGNFAPINSIKIELKAYFEGSLHEFQTPVRLFGTSFQKRVWGEVRNVPRGKIKSYKELANIIDNPKAFRAVANANGSNNIAIVIPCHRITGSNSYLGGYNGGVGRKKWLLQHELKTLCT